MVVTSALNVLMLALHFGRRALSPDTRPLHPAGWMFVPFLVYAAANVIWVTPVPWLGWQDWLGWAQMVAVFWVVVNDISARAPRKFLFGVMLSLAFVGVVLACYQRFVRPDWLMLGGTQREQFLSRSSGSFPVPNSFAGLLILLLPVTMLPVWLRSVGAVTRVGFGYLAALSLLGLGLTLSRGAWLSLALALGVWPLLRSGLGWGRRLAFSAATLAVVFGSGMLVYSVVPKAQERFDYLMRDGGERSRPVMWRAAWEICRGHPLLGGGAGSYGVLFERHRPEHEQKDPQWTHNDYLNTLSDYGVVGFGLFFGVAGLVTWRCLRKASPEKLGSVVSEVRVASHRVGDWTDRRAFSTALAVGVLAFAMNLVVDFHLKIPALALFVATVAGLVVSRTWPAVHESSQRRYRGIVSAVVGIFVLVWWVKWINPLYSAEAIRDRARRDLDTLAAVSVSPAQRLTVASAARDALGRAIALAPSNAQAWADLAYTAAILGREQPSLQGDLGRSAESDARRALAHATEVPEFWLRLGVALDMQGKWREAGLAFTEALRLAPVSAPTWFYYAYHLSLNAVTVPLARAAIATSLRLDPSPPEGEALCQDLAARR
jgi:O-antigen ligase